MVNWNTDTLKQAPADEAQRMRLQPRSIVENLHGGQRVVYKGIHKMDARVGLDGKQYPYLGVKTTVDGETALVMFTMVENARVEEGINSMNATMLQSVSLSENEYVTIEMGRNDRHAHTYKDKSRANTYRAETMKPTVSGTHARVEIRRDRDGISVLFQDQNSTNGSNIQAELMQSQK